jgi:hypothetical protein
MRALIIVEYMPILALFKHVDNSIRYGKCISILLGLVVFVFVRHPYPSFTFKTKKEHKQQAQKGMRIKKTTIKRGGHKLISAEIVVVCLKGMVG